MISNSLNKRKYRKYFSETLYKQLTLADIGSLQILDPFSPFHTKYLFLRYQHIILKDSLRKKKNYKNNWIKIFNLEIYYAKRINEVLL